MTHDEMIEAVAIAMQEQPHMSGWEDIEHEDQEHMRMLACAAIRVIAPAVLEEAAGAAMRAVLAVSLSKAVWDDVSALKTRYE